MSLFSSVLDALYAAVGCCIPDANISINGRAYRIVKLLGEGGFSFVYLVEDGSGNQYAMKKIRCTLGTEDAKVAQREVEVYRLFEHDHIIRMLDTATITDNDGSTTIYIFLPYYKRGNLQDAISRNQLYKRHFTENQMLHLFRGVCSAVEFMHDYKGASGARTGYTTQNPILDDEGGDHHHQQQQQTKPLLSSTSQQETSSAIETHTPGKEGEVVPWAHRDIKPGNVLLSDDGETPILMDFGSACRARIEIDNRQEALKQQDLAAEHCTMPFRAPELFDVKTETTLDEKVDIWSLGCTLYAMAYGQSPFEVNSEQGGSVALAVLNGQFKFPTDHEVAKLYSPEFKDFISWMLTSDPKTRPDIHQVIDRTEELLKRRPQESSA
ncbi:other/NAK protein kinase [Zychaea mexicana]|uniref:other/NAK protein kinase n=1 Tax=Zychaea mexicana TaxID=64656 RepID=UPI0022FE292D|nr:other/NAK protein kinase [Zychaea mexicana]KAI9496663.1 other/NAK protein kinase [Zychaea mexicana]